MQLVIFGMKAIILAGGFGTRLAHISGDKPKPLVEVGGKAILERNIEFLLKNGINDIRLSLHHKADKIIEFCNARFGTGTIEYVIEEKPLGTGGGIKFASRDLKEIFFVLNADTLSDINISNFLLQKAPAIACAYLPDARDFGLVEIQKGKASAFVEKPKNGGPGYINAGYYLLTPGAFNHVTQESFMIEQEVFPYLAKRGELNAFIHNGYWTDVGTEERFMQANAYHSL